VGETGIKIDKNIHIVLSTSKTPFSVVKHLYLVVQEYGDIPEDHCITVPLIFVPEHEW
jgi:hypothetical protein